MQNQKVSTALCGKTNVDLTYMWAPQMNTQDRGQRTDIGEFFGDMKAQKLPSL